MPTPSAAAAGNVMDVAQAIQLSLSPVFLLTGVAGALAVMTGRLARIVDRGRDLSERARGGHAGGTKSGGGAESGGGTKSGGGAESEGGGGAGGGEGLTEELRAELAGLDRRRRFVGVAITSCTVSAVLLCMVIIALFVDVMVNAPISGLIGVLFVASTVALVIGWGSFLREVHLATKVTHGWSRKQGS